MSEIFETWSLEQRAAEAGRSVEDQRTYERGYEQAQASIKEAMSRPMPAASFASQQPQQLIPDQMRALPRGDKGTWYRSTVAGQLAAVVSPPEPDEDAEEAKAARAFADEYEYRYARRPTPIEARFAVCRRSDGVHLAGDVRDLAGVFRQAGLRFAVIDMTEPLPVASVNLPVSRG